MKLNLFQEVVINRDFPELKIATGDIAILNDYVVKSDLVYQPKLVEWQFY